MFSKRTVTFCSHLEATEANAGLCLFESTGSVPDPESEATDKPQGQPYTQGGGSGEPVT